MHLKHFPVGTVIAITQKCMTGSGRDFFEREDAQDHEGGERGGGLYGERSAGRRKSSRVEKAVQLRTDRSPHFLGLKRANSGGSRRCQFSRTVRSRQHPAQELPSLHARVDHERKKPKLVVDLTTRR